MITNINIDEIYQRHFETMLEKVNDSNKDSYPEVFSTFVSAIVALNREALKEYHEEVVKYLPEVIFKTVSKEIDKALK